jgi:hypothetical protein
VAIAFYLLLAPSRAMLRADTCQGCKGRESALIPIYLAYALAFVLPLVVSASIPRSRPWLAVIGVGLAIIGTTAGPGRGTSDDSADFKILILGLLFLIWSAGILTGVMVRLVFHPSR